MQGPKKLHYREAFRGPCDPGSQEEMEGLAHKQGFDGQREVSSAHKPRNVSKV